VLKNSPNVDCKIPKILIENNNPFYEFIHTASTIKELLQYIIRDKNNIS